MLHSPAGVEVSVIVPVFNPGIHLRPCAESLIGQTLSPERYEVIFVDDGSSDESPAYLDELVAEHEQIRVIHQPNSGWPGQPRNVGIDTAVGTYVFFCDHDDWLAPDALERLTAFADECSSDIVLPKTAGLGRRVPYHLYRHTVRSCTLATASVMDSLVPHKLFRRSFLLEHGIRFPEGRRRLEDHLFVVDAYLHAETISIYADATCYFHVLRDDGANAGLNRIEWTGYFTNLSEALDLVEANTEPGEFRDQIYRRWFQVEMVARLSGGRRLRMSDAEATDLFAQAHRVAARYFGPGVVAALAPVSRPVGQAIIDGDADVVRELAAHTAPWRVSADLLQAAWPNDQRLQITGVARLSDVRPSSDLTDAPPLEARLATAFPALAPHELREALEHTSLDLQLIERSNGARWSVPVEVHRAGLTAIFTADLDADTAAGGGRLPDGLWDVHVQYNVLGLNGLDRPTLTAERRPGRVLVEPVDDDTAPTVVGYFSRKAFGLCLDVGLTRHRRLRKPKARPAPPPEPPPPPPPAPVPPPVAGPARRAIRKARRLLAR